MIIEGTTAALTTAPRLTEAARPSRAQLAWQREELAMFVHLGMNTFTEREWGEGTEDPALFDPAHLDARQWARTAREAGFGTLILTAKHHDGFCLWPTATTTHSVAASPWRGGSGDVVREAADACAAEGIRFGIYCSPWDRNAPSYGSGREYDDLLIAQLTELLTGYGEIAEVWFDGAVGETARGRSDPWTLDSLRRGDPEGAVWRPRRDRCLDPPGLVLARVRDPARRRSPPRSVSDLGRSQQQVVAERATEPRRPPR